MSGRTSGGQSSSVAGTAMLTPRPTTATALTANTGDYVEADCSNNVVTVTAPTSVTGRWGVRRSNNAVSTISNKVTVVYPNSAGTSTSIDFLYWQETRVFYPTGAGFEIESGWVPPLSLLTSASSTAAGYILSPLIWYGADPTIVRPQNLVSPALWVGLSETVKPNNAIADFDVVVTLNDG